jgi:hypothetical protein
MQYTYTFAISLHSYKGGGGLHIIEVRWVATFFESGIPYSGVIKYCASLCGISGIESFASKSVNIYRRWRRQRSEFR